ncbi:MAG: hypothetical protein Unbinned3065contig1002_41 [Prokaryotic dsDNA virus sp.]|jgi:hypothetical protein|nr:MAG: hypothetical protein Unbinned3065contig1002_41 [Prokaryotic dsDNA virus sp.]
MKVLVLVVFIITNDGAYDVTSMPVSECPPRDLTEQYYNHHQQLGAFKQWAAVCTTVDFTAPTKKET